MPLNYLDRRSLIGRRGLLRNSLLAVLLSFISVCGLAGCNDISKAPPPDPGPGVLTLVTAALPNGTVNQPYATVVGGSGGITPYTWSLAASSPAIPAGLSLDANTGAITGIPTATGTTSLVFRLEDDSTPDAGCGKIAFDHDQYHATAAGDFHLITPGRGCEPALPSHNLAGDGWNHSLYVVGESCVTQRLVLECSFTGRDQRHSVKRNGGHDDTYVHGR